MIVLAAEEWWSLEMGLAGAASQPPLSPRRAISISCELLRSDQEAGKEGC